MGQKQPGRHLSSTQFLLFLLPWLISFGLFTLYPFLHSFVLSLFRYDPVSAEPSSFVGLSNYQAALKDPLLRKAFLNTFIFVVGTVPVTTLLSFLIAQLMRSTVKGRGFFRAGFFLPSVISMVALSLVFRQLYAPDGPLNGFLHLCGIQGKAWLLETAWALPAIMVMDIWASVGYYAIIYLAALESIPTEVFEALELDGGGGWTRMWRISWPLVKPITAVVLIINSIRSLQVFVEVFVLTQGGPLHSTLTAVLYLYDRAFHLFELGYASTIAYLVFLVTLLFSLVQLRYLKFGGGVTA